MCGWWPWGMWCMLGDKIYMTIHGDMWIFFQLGSQLVWRSQATPLPSVERRWSAKLVSARRPQEQNLHEWEWILFCLLAVQRAHSVSKPMGHHPKPIACNWSQTISQDGEGFFSTNLFAGLLSAALCSLGVLSQHIHNPLHPLGSWPMPNTWSKRRNFVPNLQNFQASTNWIRNS